MQDAAADPRVAAEATPSEAPAELTPRLGAMLAEDDELAGRVRAEPPPVEQELLAGIEEFRNQLAQMKGEAAPAAAAKV
jgi:hypothetical protein